MSKQLTISLDDLRNMPTPAATRTWQPVAHIEARNRLMGALQRQGFEVTNERVVTEPLGQRAYGILSLGFTASPDRTWTPEALWVNVHDQSRALTFGAGERVAACTNGCVWAETVVKSKRTSGILDRVAELADGFARGLRGSIVENEQRRQAYASHLIGDNWARVLLVRIAEAGVIPSSKILKTLAEFEAPSFEYSHRVDSLLGLQSAVTHVLKDYNPEGQHDRSLLLTNLLDQEVTF